MQYISIMLIISTSHILLSNGTHR